MHASAPGGQGDVAPSLVGAGGPWGEGRRLAARAIRWLRGLTGAAASGLLWRQRQHITLKRLDVADPDAPPATDASTECVVVESVEAFEAAASGYPASFRDSPAQLRRRIARGCVVTLARRRRPDGSGFDVIGYEIAERGVFSALGRRAPAAAEVVFSHYVEVLPACRGQRIHRRLFATRDAHFRARAGRVVCGACDPDNRASLRALARDGAVIVGTVERVALLGVLVLRYAAVARPGHALDAWLPRPRAGVTPPLAPGVPYRASLTGGVPLTGAATIAGWLIERP